jgi:hypothetical protein
MTRKDDPCNHRVAKFHGSSFPVPGGHQIAGVLRSNGVEGSHSSPNLVS